MKCENHNDVKTLISKITQQIVKSGEFSDLTTLKVVQCELVFRILDVGEPDLMVSRTVSLRSLGGPGAQPGDTQSGSLAILAAEEEEEGELADRK